MAVELAKLSLWLDSFTLGAPLSFLDHHLKCGNSLIGARDMQTYLPPGSVRRSEFLQAMGNLLQVAEITDATASEVEQSRQLYCEAVKWLHPTKERVNVQTAKHFISLGNEGKVIEWAYRTERKTDDPLEKPHLENFLATQTVADEKRFFHWELEFPEVFFERHGAKENPGFDAVVGNPPYENAWKMTDVDGAVRAIIAKCSQHPETLVGHWDLYVPFISRALWLLQKGGLHSFIVPDALAREKYAMPLRRLLVAHTSLVRWMHFEGENVFDEVSRHCVIYILRKEQPPEGSQLTVDPPLSVGESRESSHRIVQSDFLVGPAQQFRLGEDAGVAADLLKRIENQSVRLGQYCYVMIGATTHSKDRTSFRKADILTSFPKGNAKPFFDGKNLRRYEIVRDGRYLDYRRDEMYGPRVPELFESPKVVVRNVTDENERLVAAFDKDGLYCDDLVNCVTLYENVEGAEVQTNFDGYLRLSVHLPSLQYTLAIVASSLMSWYFRSVFATGTLQGSYSHTYPQQVRAFPIRRISFTTQEKERAQLMEKGKKLYERCLAKGDQACVLGFVEHALKQTPEQADVVHDLLAFLAEQMIEMNKAKQTEVKGFLGWLERELGAKVDDLKNKTKLKDYHDGTFEVLLEVLKENRRSLSVDPSERKFQDRLAKEYTHSLTKLGPLKTRLEATDRLIDQIVYKLYGLSDAEIAVVEGIASTL